MKIAFVIESFLPFGGGSEWSTYYLAQDLAKRGNEVVVITPNMGSRKDEMIGKVKTVRFPFYLKIKSKGKLPGNFAYTNLLWILWAAIFNFIYLIRERVDVIHVQGKYSVTPIILANLFLRKPTLVTIRDYQVICNYGFCLWNKNKSCNLSDYFLKDFKFYLENYSGQKNIVSILSNFFFAIYGRISRNILKWCSYKFPVIVLSKKQKAIFIANGFKRVSVIGNSISFPEKLTKNQKQKSVLFAGRFTLGKGVSLLIDVIPEFFRSFPDFKFYFAGQGPIGNRLNHLSKKYKNLKVLKFLPHEKLLELMAKSQLVVTPSIWPEPFGRVPLESISQGTPCMVTNRGGLPEIISHGKYGIVSSADPKSILDATAAIIKNNNQFTKNIRRDFLRIKEKFQDNITKKYLEKYQELVK